MPRKIKMSEWAFQPARDGQFEQWFDIPGFEGKYEMTVGDRIRNKKTKEEIKPRIHKNVKEVKIYGRDKKCHTKTVKSLHEETFNPDRIKWLWEFMNPNPDKPAYEGKHYLYHIKKPKK